MLTVLKNIKNKVKTNILKILTFNDIILIILIIYMMLNLDIDINKKLKKAYI